MNIVESMTFADVRVGDIVTRFRSGIPFRVPVTDVTEEFIVCGPWLFSRQNGAQVDEDLGWSEICTGAYIKID